MSILIKILSGLLTCFALLTASCVEAETKQNAWIKGWEMSPGQCVAACQKDPLFCVQQINGYLIEAMNGRGTPSATTINMNVCKGAQITPDCYMLIPLHLRLRNTTLETFPVSHLLPEKAANGQVSSVGCMKCHGSTGGAFSFVWVDAAEEISPLRRN